MVSRTIFSVCLAKWYSCNLMMEGNHSWTQAAPPKTLLTPSHWWNDYSVPRLGRALKLVHDKTVFGTSGYKVREGGNNLVWVTKGDYKYTSWTQTTEQEALLTPRHSWNTFLEPRPAGRWNLFMIRQWSAQSRRKGKRSWHHANLGKRNCCSQ